MVISKEISVAYAEVLNIIKELNENDYRKIPKERIDLYEKYKDNEYKFEYNKSLPIEFQVSPKAKAILANIFVKYIANEDEKAKILEKDKKEFIELENQKNQIKLNNLFEKKERFEKNQKHEIAEYKKRNIIEKIMLKIKSLIRRK